MRKEDRLLAWADEERTDEEWLRLSELVPDSIDISAGLTELRIRLRQNTSTAPELSCGDVDARWEMAESSGDETVCGSTTTPGQSIVEEIGRAYGVTYRANEELRFGEKVWERDAHRWELDPASAEDYAERTESSHRTRTYPSLQRRTWH